ncbi:MAG: hypothetical protein KA765_01910 [Thermoflexales bacterium]|nr:hypothetical protein [Thermoflexales bacterium]
MTALAKTRTRRDRFADWAVIGHVVIALLIGWAIKSGAEGASQALSSDVGSFNAPMGWRSDKSAGLAAMDTRTTSGVPTTFSITTQALDSDASLNALSTRRTIKLAQELDGFSMLDTRADTVNGESATTLNYAYVVVPEAGTAGSARVPVVVEATDTLIKRNGQLVIVHFSSESTAFAGLADLRAKIISSVKLP